LRGYTGMANAVVEAFQDGTVDDYQSAMQELVACFDGRDDERISLLADAGLGLAMQARLNQLLGDLADSYGRLQQLRCRRKRLASVGLGWLLNSRIQKSLAKCDELSRHAGRLARRTGLDHTGNMPGAQPQTFLICGRSARKLSSLFSHSIFVMLIL
jgi:hypothetical protein